MLTEPPEASICPLLCSAQLCERLEAPLQAGFVRFCFFLVGDQKVEQVRSWGLSNAGVAGIEHTKKQNPVDGAIPSQSGTSLAGPEPTYSAQQCSSRSRFVGSIAHEWHKLLILRHYPFFLFASPKAPFPFGFFSLFNTCITNCHN